MRKGTLQDLTSAYELLEKCEVEDSRDQVEIDRMVTRLRRMADAMTATYVRRVAGC